MMGAPRTEDTKMLEPFKRQYFQWYCKDKYTQRRVKELFDILFEYLRIHEGTSYHATYNQWTGRRHEWNKKWNIADSSRGLSLSTPPDLLEFQIWFEGLQFAGEYKPHETVSGESLNPFDVNLSRYLEPSSNVLSTTPCAMNHKWNTESHSASHIGRSHSEPSLVSLPFVSPPCLAEHLLHRSSHAEGVPNTSSRSRWSSAPTLEAMNQRIYPPMLLDANPTLEDFEIFHPDVLNTTHTADNSSSISQAQPPCSQPMTSHSFHVPVEHAVAPFHAALQHRPNGSQLQSQDNDPDLSTNTFALSQSYDMWLG